MTDCGGRCLPVVLTGVCVCLCVYESVLSVHECLQIHDPQQGFAITILCLKLILSPPIAPLILCFCLSGVIETYVLTLVLSDSNSYALVQHICNIICAVFFSPPTTPPIVAATLLPCSMLTSTSTRAKCVQQEKHHALCNGQQCTVVQDGATTTKTRMFVGMRLMHDSCSGGAKSNPTPLSFPPLWPLSFPPRCRASWTPHYPTVPLSQAQPHGVLDDTIECL